MSTYSLSGTGVQSLSANVTALHVTITTLPAGLTSGRANPTNHFDIGLLRFGDGIGYWPAIPITGGPDWVGVPIGSTSIGYAVLNGAVISVAEVIGGVSPSPVIAVTAPTRFMPHIISPASIECIGQELVANANTVGSSGGWVSNNLAVFVPLRVSDTFVCTTAWVIVGTAAGNHWDIGVYDDTMALIAHTGSVLEVGASSMQTNPLSVTLIAGHYWLAMAADATGLTTASYAVTGSPRTRALGIRVATSNFPLASSPALSAPTFQGVPAFGIASYTP